MPVDGLDDVAVEPWLTVLDRAERERAKRFILCRHRVEFAAAHVLTRVILGRLVGQPAGALRFMKNAHGKPSAWIGNTPAALSFNVSHTKGMVGIAVTMTTDRALGFDLELLTLKPMNFAMWKRFLSPQELVWIQSLPDSRRPTGLLQLWTLKEALLKAIGAGLSVDLTSFWFDTDPPALHFISPQAQTETDWWFDQRILGGMFMAAIGLRRLASECILANWETVYPDDLLKDDGYS